MQTKNVEYHKKIEGNFVVITNQETEIARFNMLTDDGVGIYRNVLDYIHKVECSLFDIERGIYVSGTLDQLLAPPRI